MITLEGIDDIVVNGGIVVTSDGARIGSVEQVFLSEDSGQPAFVTVRTGLFGMSESFVPLSGAAIDGSRVRVAFDRDRVRNGPRIESDRGSITAEEENKLYNYYGLDLSAAQPLAGSPDGATSEAESASTADSEPEPAGVRRPAPPPPPPHGHGAPEHGPPAPGPVGPPHPPHLLKHVVAGHPHHSPPPPPPRLPAATPPAARPH